MRITNKFLIVLSLTVFALFSQSASAGCVYPDGQCASTATEEAATAEEAAAPAEEAAEADAEETAPAEEAAAE